LTVDCSLCVVAAGKSNHNLNFKQQHVVAVVVLIVVVVVVAVVE